MDLRAKAVAVGIETDFIDAQGHAHATNPAVLQAILEAVDHPSDHRLLPGPVVVRAGQPTMTELGGAAKLPVDWAISREGGQGDIARGQSAHQAIAWPADLAPGVYRVRLTDVDGKTDHSALVVAPDKAFAGTFDRVWVLTIQLYSLRSASNWGIGDFTDLMTMIRFAARAGAAGIGLNPLHALFDNHPADCSPYSPNSRLFLNPLYIDVTRAPNIPAEFLSEHTDNLELLRRADLVDYTAVAGLKWRALRLAFERFRRDGAKDDMAAFDIFRQERGDNLSRFACFEFLRHKHPGPWWEWPLEWRTPDVDRLTALRHGPDAREIAYFEFIQWLADSQLQQCCDLAVELGMPVGLYLDVAVGVKADGFDAWNEQSVISRHASVGAPPDLLNTAGQNWGLAGFSAAGLERTLFRPFRDMMEASMRYAGAIRLDHVLGLQRIYLVPSGFSAREGVYVRMPLAALLAVIAAESQKHRCIVVGEDLGTVPEGFRERLAERGIWSYRVMIFERNHDGSFTAPEHYAADALVTFSTHDLPTFAGWASGHDLEVKRGLGLDPGETDDQRRWAVGAFHAATRHGSSEAVTFSDAVGFLGRTPSRILAVAMEDLQQVREQPNVPGTIDEHPNWRRKLPLTIEAAATELDLAKLHDALGSRWRTGNV
ncbi:4-alpha-glucanotransferase [Bradyrhizobium prioriisuperbiae]|uniref:4-alpha-glucanotransferase n=1 Tax=Bradyrhizobium prioriisuperbiae TaxID=2854389 RepID=UPI0028E63F4B|nr:4-alpha-glucanotransferase [Bradyrhizobium prioritasuperba]